MGQEFTSCFLDVRKPRKMLNFGQELKFKQTSSESNKISFIDPYDHGESLKKNMTMVNQGLVSPPISWNF